MTDHQPQSTGPSEESSSNVGIYDSDGGTTQTGTPSSRVGVYDRPEGGTTSSRNSTIMIAVSALVLALLILLAYQVLF